MNTIKSRLLAVCLSLEIFNPKEARSQKVADKQKETGARRFSSRALDRGQTREICEKQEKYPKGKVVTFTVQSLILCQYPVDLLNFLELY